MPSLLDRDSTTPQRPTWAEINLNNLAANFNVIKERVSHVAKVLAVVKADAYGHGAVQCARRLAKEGAEWFGVAIRRRGLSFARPESVSRYWCLEVFGMVRQRLVFDRGLRQLSTGST
jgi:alanine racemase